MRTHALFLLSFLTIGCPKPICGDNTQDENEACDDGNLNDADGCEANCSLPACQNGIVDPGEVCLFEPVSFATDTTPGGIVSADFDKDGFLDIVTANAFGASLSVLLGDGTESFARLPDIDLSGTGSQLVSGDFDGDGFLDLAALVITGAGSMEVFRGLGDGSFEPLATLPTPTPEALAIGDFNGDGRLDLVAGGPGVDLFLNSGAGGFEAPRSFSTVVSVAGLAVGNFNEDAFLDVVVTHGVNEDTLRALLGDGAGNLAIQATQPAGSIPGDLIAQDLNGDGVLDLAVCRFPSREVGILIGDGVGLFSETQTISVIGPASIATGDLNQDGELDLAVASDLDPDSFISHLALLLGDNTGTFSGVPLLTASNGNLEEIALADFNEDGALDAALTDQSNDQVLVFFSEP